MRAWLLAAALAALAALACGRTPTPAPVVDAAPHVQTVRLDPGAMERLGVRVEPAGSAAPSRVLRVPGTLEYNFDKYAEVGVPLDGRVTKVDVRVGDHVKKGQELGQILIPSIGAAQADYLATRASYSAAKKNQEREDDLLSKQLTTAREAEIARSDALKAAADLAAAEARLRAMRVDLPATNSAVSTAGVLPLSAPIDGLVVGRKANLGVYLTPSDTAFVVADVSELAATLDIPEFDLAYLQVGAPVDLSFDAQPGRVLQGSVSLVEPQVGKATRTARARVSVPNPDGTLRVGLFVRADIHLAGDRAGALLVAAGAVQPLGEDDVVFVERGPGVFEVRVVHVLRRSAELVEIGDGLSAGERIAVAGAFLLRGEVSKQ